MKRSLKSLSKENDSSSYPVEKISLSKKKRVRLKDALRENLRKRKEQARYRKQTEY